MIQVIRTQSEEEAPASKKQLQVVHVALILGMVAIASFSVGISMGSSHQENRIRASCKAEGFWWPQEKIENNEAYACRRVEH